MDEVAGSRQGEKEFSLCAASDRLRPARICGRDGGRYDTGAGVWKGGGQEAETKRTEERKRRQDMKGLAKIYDKYKNPIESLLFPAALFLYPFIGVCQGLEVVDSTYSLANFQYFGEMDGTWMVATFLANVWGNLLMHLPFGGTLIGMNCYTTLVQSAMALMVYQALRKRMPAPLLFLGEMIALGLCWSPSTVLYQNLTYFFMTAGILLLYRGLTDDSLQSRVQRLYFAAAGLCLGANVAVRMPNVVYAAFILVVWYGIVLCQRSNGCYEKTKKAAGKEQVTSAVKKSTPARTLAVSTGWCLAGYLAGFGMPFLAICLRYGISAYPDMVRTLFAMTEQATDYKPVSMLTGMFGDYGKGLCWLAFAGLCMASAWLAISVRQRLYGTEDHVGLSDGGRQNDASSGRWNAYKITGVIIKAGYCLLLAVLIRFYWGRGMFDFRYYWYSSIYYPAVLLLLVTIGTAVFCLLKKDVAAEKKILAAAVVLEIFLTPLGSNNILYPIINNLFIAAPFLLWAAYDADSACRKGYAFMPAFLWQYPLVVLVALVLVQSIGFHAAFAFNDGVWGEPRDMQVAIPEKAAGVWTNRENGALLEELAGFVKEEGLTGRKVICYDELPGLSYLLDMPPALSSNWPDLDSYRMEEYLRDMEAVAAENRAGKELPVVIVSTPVAAYLSDDGEAIAWFGVDMEACAANEKLQILGEFLGEHGYTECFGNAGYVVYCVN